MTATDLALILLGYLAGSISSAIVVCRLMGLPDPREHGSGNPGATNVLRVGGKGAAALTLLGDSLKGLIPVLLARALHAPEWVLGAVALGAVLGHLYPVFFGFRGGKGVATALGAFLGINPWLGLAWAATWLAMAALFRISSLSALTAMILTPFYAWFLTGSRSLTALLSAIAVLVIARHHSNIRNLLAGTESRI
jgi:glycerol-3-phosphate acyltransferase PlsY